MKMHWKHWLPLGGAAGKEGDNRRLELELDLPIQRGEPSRKHDKEILAETETWQQLANHPIELLRKQERFLKRLNSENISWPVHYKCLNRALQAASPALRKIYQDQSGKASLPESHDRREGLMAAISTCHHLAIGYLLYLHRDYQLPLRQYQEVKDQVQLAAVRALELFYLEQRLRAMRYQKLSRSTWTDINRLFITFYVADEAGSEFPGLNVLQPPGDPTISSGSISSASISFPLASLRQVFTAIHLLGLMDVNTLPVQNLALADELITRALGRTAIVPDDMTPLDESAVLVYYGQAGPAYYHRQDEKIPHLPTPHNHKLFRSRDESDDLIASLKIDISPFEALLAREYRQLFSHVADNLARQSEDSDTRLDLGKLVTVDIMCKHLYLRLRQDAREYVIGSKVLHVYNGYMPVYKLLMKNQQAQQGKQQPAAGYALRDALAGRSSIIDWDVNSAELGQWRVMDSSAGGVHVKTQETPFTTALYIGQILAFGYVVEEMQTPILGYVTRLNRHVAGEIEVIIRILPGNPRAIAVQNQLLAEKAMALPGIFLPADEQQSLQPRLALHYSHCLPADTRVTIDFNGQPAAFLLTDMLLIQREFILYQLEADATPVTGAGQGDAA